MCGDSLSPNDFDPLTQMLADVVSRLGSLEKLRQWLMSQPCVISVELEDYLIKTNPPQRQFRVEFRMDDGSTTVKAIDISVAEGQELRFRSLHDL
jgi:hypothetical protein